MTFCVLLTTKRLLSALLLQWVLLFDRFFSSDCAATQLPLLNEEQVTGVVQANGAQCYLFAMDQNKTREVVYWAEAKLYIRLEPCVGMPHLKVSVYGCPSDGAIVNWEYMSDQARASMQAEGQALPAPWSAPRA